MTKRASSPSSGRHSSSEGKPLDLNRIITILLVVVVVGAGAYYLFTGSDVLGLFTEPEVTPATDQPAGEAAAPTATPWTYWWEVYFTDPLNLNDPENPAGSVVEELIDLIDAADQSIHVAAFEFNLTPVAEALIAAHERDVEVRWVADDEHGIEVDEFEEGHGQFAMLQDAGIEVRDDGRGALMHNKFWIFDDEIVWTGSTNTTENGVFRNNNNVIVVWSAELAAIYEREFEEMWAGEFGPTSTSTLEDQSLTIKSTDVQALFAAEDEVATHLVSLIEEASASIRFMAFSFTHDEMGAAVLERARAGAEVMGIFETRGSETEYSELPVMFCAGLEVRQDGNPRTFHHKVLVIDERTVITGSFNFSENADSSNDENVLVIRNGHVAARYLKEFDRRWAEAKVPDPAEMGCK